MADATLETNAVVVTEETEETLERPGENTDYATELSTVANADVFVYSGPLERPGADNFLSVAEAAEHKANAILIISTFGGDPDAAYIIARYLKRTYKHFSLFVFGYCKSAGTLLALGADEIVMSSRGELGPLDVQLVKPDEILFRSSGLDMSEAIEAISDYALKIFEKQFLDLLMKSGGAVTTKTAGEIATTIAVGLLAPITGQISPLKLGETERAVNIALDYADRLRAPRAKALRLIHGYSSHSFVIDFDEAKEVFGCVRAPSDLETKLERQLLVMFEDQTEYNCIRLPHPHGIAAYLKPEKKDDTDEGRQTPNLGISDHRSSDREAAENAIASDEQVRSLEGAQRADHTNRRERRSY